ncbi:2'-5' RNA ligase family protein [Candidatus Electronema sp. PJ]|uniref:2'-5' RNA ligase family protein n=1 Tax=Candidatus Electronema sp. PJ TaxID=3401572 RepID=UPI003AA8209B
MTEYIYKTAYLSLAVPISDNLLSVQQEVCQRYALIPRSEIHLTLAFFGENTAHKLVDLAKVLLDLLPSSEMSQIRIDGLGGAYSVSDGFKLVSNEGLDELKEHPRVFWLAVSRYDDLYAFREIAIKVAGTVGINTSFIAPDFFPHLTLGSAGPADHGDWRLWDVHTVPKRATIRLQLPLDQVRASKLHLTDVSISPDSVHLLRMFSV